MNRRRVGVGVVLAGALAVAILLLIGALTGAYGGLESTQTTVHVESGGDRLASFDVRVADDFKSRYVGLSETDRLGPRQGMLFVHPREERHTYVMRNMSFPLDIVFVAENGTITTIHEAPVPEGSDERRYSGQARYVLEVNRGTMDSVGASVGDRVVIPNATG